MKTSYIMLTGCNLLFLITVHCNAFVLSYAALGNNELNVFQFSNLYSVETTVLLDDVDNAAKDVGYKIVSNLQVDPVWSDEPTNTYVLKLTLLKPHLFIRSRKESTLETFVEHYSKLDNYQNNPYLLVWKNGYIKNILVDLKEDISVINYKKGIASLFQFQILDVETSEEDVSGLCDCKYQALSPNIILKNKTKCYSPDIDQPRDKLLAAVSRNLRTVKYTFSEDLHAFLSIHAEELHEIRMSIKQDAGSKIRVWQELHLLKNLGAPSKLKVDNLMDLLHEAEMQYAVVFQKSELILQREQKQCGEDCQNLSKLIKDNTELLHADQVGTVKSAMTFLRLLPILRQAKTDDILKALRSVKSKEVLQQLCDLVGYAQTVAAHQAAKSFLHFDSEYDVDNIERYLWALSIGPSPQYKVIKDVLKMSENKKNTEKVSETLLLTAASMAKTYKDVHNNSELSNLVKDAVVKLISKCSDNDCCLKYMRTLKNLQHEGTIELLLNYVKKGPRSVSMMALKALLELQKSNSKRQIVKVCRNIFFQMEKRYDSSVRTLALDVILESKPTESELKEFIYHLKSNDKDQEVKQYLLQKLQMMSEKCHDFRKTVLSIIKKNPDIFNWNVMSLKGLSTALARPMVSNVWSNISIVSVQEISKGVLKQGHVDIIMESGDQRRELFSLGLFAAGLSSFMSSSDDEEAEQEDATAGLELTVQGTQIRPFVFFKGQGELMGHVWSGTASDSTTAFQAFTLLHDYNVGIPLGSGTFAEFVMLGAASFHLAGQIQLSLWNRVAHSLVEKSAGIAVKGTLSAHTSFVQSQVEFVVAIEPKLHLESDIDFYTNVAMCIQVKQPDNVLKHNVFKIEHIPNTKHVLRKSIFKTTKFPGRTYALNRKNNEMCNVIHTV